MDSKPSISKTLLAGVAGGMAFVIAMVVTFRIIGFGIHADGILLRSNLQSPKLIAVWTTLQPLPLVITNPPLISVGIILIAIVHAFLFRSLLPAWPVGIAARGLRMALIVFCFTFLFWEFFTPFNQLGEPIPLILLELLFWAVIALAEGFVIAGVMSGGRK